MGFLERVKSLKSSARYAVFWQTGRASAPARSRAARIRVERSIKKAVYNCCHHLSVRCGVHRDPRAVRFWACMGELKFVERGQASTRDTAELLRHARALRALSQAMLYESGEDKNGNFGSNVQSWRHVWRACGSLAC